MKQLNVNTGRVAYTVNGESEIYFNPGDPEFAGQIVRAFQKCSEIAQNAKHESNEDIAELLSLTHKMDEEVRETIDNAFGEPVCEKVFGKTNAFSLAGGLPLWANFLMAVIDEIDRNMPDEKKKTSQAVQKYVKKYKTKYGKGK